MLDTYDNCPIVKFKKFWLLIKMNSDNQNENESSRILNYVENKVSRANQNKNIINFGTILFISLLGGLYLCFKALINLI